MSTTRTLAGVRLARADPQPRLGGVERRGRGGAHGGARDLAGGRVHAAGDVGGDDGAGRASFSASIAPSTGSRGAPGKPVPSSASTIAAAPSSALGARTASAARPAARSRLAAASPVQLSARDGRAARRPPGRRRAAGARRQDRRRRCCPCRRPRRPAVGRDLRDEPRQARAGALHELERRDALRPRSPSVGGPRIASASGSGSSQRGRLTRSPPRRRRSLRVWVSETHASSPSSAARRGRCRAARSPVPRRLADDLDLRQPQDVQRQRLGHRLLSAEAGGEVLGGPGAARRRTRAPPSVKSRSRKARAARSSARSSRSISSRSMPMPARAYARPYQRRSSRRLPRLFDGDGLGEVARLVDVEPAPPGDPVGEQLQRDDREQRLEHPVGRAARAAPPRRARRSRCCPRSRPRSRARRARGPPACSRRPSRAPASPSRRRRPGVFSSSSAIGPCFISPAAYASVAM